jgi:hypothetical protein
MKYELFKVTKITQEIYLCFPCTYCSSHWPEYSKIFCNKQKVHFVKYVKVLLQHIQVIRQLMFVIGCLLNDGIIVLSVCSSSGSLITLRGLCEYTQNDSYNNLSYKII